MLEERLQAKLAPVAARFYAGKDALEVADARGERLHFAKPWGKRSSCSLTCLNDAPRVCRWRPAKCACARRAFFAAIPDAVPDG
jgi:hypothetical protein